MKISLLHPTRGRPNKSYTNAKEWIEKAGCEVELIVSLDNSDETIVAYKALYKDVTVLINDNKSVVDATNHAAKIASGDILLYLSDDFKCFDNWGPAVQKEFAGENRPLLIKVDDCLQRFDVPVLTMPIMNRSLYERLVYFWQPDYRSMFVDEDLYWVSKKLGALKMCERLKFEHQHVSVGKSKDDETYRRSAANWDQGKALFAKRKAMGFPV